VPHVTTSSGGYLTGIESELLQLTNDQIRTSRRMAANPRTIVRGQAGTGKTVIAIERARQLSNKGPCPLPLLQQAGHIRRTLAGEDHAKGVDVYHVHALYAEVIQKAGMLDRLEGHSPDDPEFYSRIFPQLFVDSALEIELDGWDVLMVDEALDLLTPDNMDAFDVILREGLTRGCWHIFLD
jgi:hypothetical protein